ncbi:adenylosuccinate synthetase [archaeon]|nr:adenylosuccinate synthetase [archaeon]
MKKAKVVIGSAYGDEGKGVITDYLSSQDEESIVIRFNGGAQAGHTVVTPDGKRHVFGHFASNSFLPNATTVLSEFFVVNPLLFKKEKQALENFGVNPTVFIHEDAYITTPFEMILNQWVEDSRGANRHGSCGVGFGETIAREEVGGITFKMKDISNRDLLLSVRNYFLQRVKELGLEDVLSSNRFLIEDSFIDKFYDDLIKILADVKQFSNKLPDSNNIVFEGAQGLLLDQKFGFFPHVTRSNTGLKNVVSLSKKYNIDTLDVFYASRCYSTRHGAGPLKNALNNKPYKGITDLTNIPNQYQGNLRFAYLDLDILKSTIDVDKESVNAVLDGINVNTNIGITCLNQSEEIIFYYNNILHKEKNKDFTKFLSDIFYLNVLGGWTGTRDGFK